MIVICYHKSVQASLTSILTHRDLLYVEQNRIYPIEIKKNSSPKNPIRNFSALKKYEMEIEAGLSQWGRFILTHKCYCEGE